MNVILLLLPLICSLVISALTMSQVKSAWFVGLRKPKFNPPNYLFGPIWTILYLIMGYSASRVYEKESIPAIYWVQLTFNLVWSILFFKFKRIGYALVDIVLLEVSIIWTIIVFYPIDEVASMILLPYLLWVTFASYLNISFYILNRKIE